jgi:hypothetical protein
MSKTNPTLPSQGPDVTYSYLMDELKFRVSALRSLLRSHWWFRIGCWIAPRKSRISLSPSAQTHYQQLKTVLVHVRTVVRVSLNYLHSTDPLSSVHELPALQLVILNARIQEAQSLLRRYAVLDEEKRKHC